MTARRRITNALGLAVGLVAGAVAVAGPATQVGAEGEPVEPEWVSSSGEVARLPGHAVDLDSGPGPDARVLNGTNVDGNQYPWSAHVYVTDGFGFSVCGGTVIKPRWILTAAHCVTSAGPEAKVPAAWVSVAVGGGRRPGTLGGPAYKPVAGVFVNQAYDPVRALNDVALLKLKKSTNATPLPLATPAAEQTRSPGTMVTVAGWGVTRGSNIGIPIVQQKTQIPLRTSKECRDLNSGFRSALLLCAGWASGEAPRPQGDCGGDSGSAVMAHTGFGPVQIGLVSFGFSVCPRLDEFSYYTRIDAFRRGIANFINGLPKNPAVRRCNGTKATLTGTSGADVLVGTNKRDVIVSLGGHDDVDARNGNDLVCLGKGNDTGQGGGGEDKVLGEGGADKIMGGPKADRLFGHDGVDRIFGEEGADLINGGERGDTLRGQGQADRVLGAAGEDDIDGGAGDDELLGQTGGDTVWGAQGDDVVNGGPGRDLVVGGVGADELFGEGGPDTLRGQGGSDDLDGGPQTDICDGGGGTDTGTSCETRIQIP